jgi:hypothetical protein
MNRTRIALLGLFAVLVAVWVSSATLPPPAAPAPAATQAQAAKNAKTVKTARPARGPQQRDISSFDLDEAAERLRAQLETAKRPQAPERNPFEFAAAPAPRRIAEPTPPPIAVPVVPPGSQPPPFVLTGVAEHKNGDAIERTAILTGSSLAANMTGGAGGEGQIYFAKAGDKVIGRYEVTAVGADAIELRELASGQTVRLGLR